MRIELMLQGYSILLVAVLLNAIANQFKIMTWYSLITSEAGFFGAIRSIGPIDFVFLFVLYPLALAYSTQIPMLLGIIK